jgi:hypothetical protein
MAAAIRLDGSTASLETSSPALACMEHRLYWKTIMTKYFVRFPKILLGLLLFLTVIYYGLVQWKIIWLSEPVTLRESAIIVDVRGYLDPHAPRPYTLESIPQYTNGYGLGCLWGTAPFSAFLPFSEYSSLRLANAFYLALLLLVLGIGSSTGGPWQRLFGIVLVYALFVSSPSMAAGPDVLGCFIYTLSWVIVVRADFKSWALFSSILLAFLAWLTKPYFVLSVGAIGSYLFLFRSKKIGLIYFLSTITLFAPGLWLIHSRYPYYFFQTFTMHWEARTHAYIYGFKQWRDFIILVPVPCCACAWSIAKQLVKSYRTAPFEWSLNAAFFPKSFSISPYDLGALVALTVLGSSLSWHGGAYLIYFWHLALPLMALSVMSRPVINPLWLCMNVALLLWLRPPLPPAETSNDWAALGELIAKHPHGHVDPYFEPLIPPGSSVAIDNAQSEYALMIGRACGSPALITHCNEYLDDFAKRINERQFDSFIIIPGVFLSRPPFYSMIFANYEVSKACEIRPYYFSFRDRLSFGQKTVSVYFLTPLKTVKPPPKVLPP